jgi:glycosyltransferase involved in cell wall biosynthesis
VMPAITISAARQVSVVMGVYNGAAALRATLSSVLTQEGCDFEFIVIDDGSTDATGSILQDCATHDGRLRVVHQQHAGLTRALIRGCELATGDFIARQDVGDYSVPGRLAAQVALLCDRPDAVMTACGVRFCGPREEWLYEVKRPMLQLDRGLRASRMTTLAGPPHHGATMFRRDAYVGVGGYRHPFTVAQDLDLWLRLVEKGLCLGIDNILYVARLEAGSVSSRRRNEQFRMARLAMRCKEARANSGDDADVLEGFHDSPGVTRPVTRAERARFNYFIASCMRHREPLTAKAYYAAALRNNPLHFKALVHWAIER